MKSFSTYVNRSQRSYSFEDMGDQNHEKSQIIEQILGNIGLISHRITSATRE